MRLSIRLQLLLPLAPLIIGLLAMTAWTAWSLAGAARQQILEDMDHIAATVRTVVFPRNPQTLRLMKGLSGAEIVVCDAKGHPISDGAGQPLSTLPHLPATLPPPSEDGPLDRIVVGDTAYLYRTVTLAHEVLYLFSPEALLEQAAWRAVRPALVIGGVGGLLAILVAAWLIQQITRRIHELRRRTRLIAAGDFSPMPLPRRNDELRELGQSINDMAQQLTMYQESLRTTERLRLLGQVSAGLAHQLRNGITGARLALQVYVREHGADDSLQVALRQLSLMGIYLTRFLDLGKATQLKIEAIDWVILVNETLDLLRPQCEHANIELRRDFPKHPMTTRIDIEQMRQVLVNLCVNAIEAAGPEGRVNVRVRQEKESMVMEVVDSGPGVPADVAAKLFEPFVTSKPEGVGLGLAVARQIVEAHGGRLGWSRVSEGTCFRLEVPVMAVHERASE